MRQHNSSTHDNRFTSTLKPDYPVFQVGPSLDYATIADAVAAAAIKVNLTETIVIELEPGHTYTWAGTISSTHSYILKSWGAKTRESNY